jgi:hypothetical protein
MAGIFGDEINNRSDFFRELARAKRLAQSLIGRFPNDVNFRAVLTQIEAIEQWTANGRTPTSDERSKIGMGLRLHREYEVTNDAEILELKDVASGVNNYFDHWPDDTVASDPKNMYLVYQ